MRDAKLVEPFAVPEIYCDGIEHVVANGMMMATGYRIMPKLNGELMKIAVVRFIIKAENVIDAIADAKEALEAPMTPLRKARHLEHH